MLSKYLMGAATAVALAGPAMADNWTMTTTWPSSLELIEIDKKFVEIANALVDDADLTIEFIEGGSLVPAGEVFGAVESGTIQAGGDWPGYWAGRDAAFSPLATTFYASLSGAVLLGLAALVQGDIDPAAWSWRVWSGMGFLAIFGTAIAYTWFTDAVHRLGAGHASIFINLVPVFAVLQAALLLDERLGLAVLAGGALVIAGVWLTSYQKGKTT